MELEDFKKIWNEYDRKLDKSVQLNVGLLKEIKLEKVRSQLHRSTVGSALELILNVAAVLLLGSFVADHISMIRFAVPGLLLQFAAVLLLISNVYELASVRNLDYSAPVTLIQRRLEALRAHKIRVTQWIFVCAVLIWTPLLIVGLKAFFNVDAYVALGSGYLLTSLAAGILVIFGAIAVSKKYGDRLGKSPFVKRLADDISGKNLRAATAFIQEIEQFEKEVDLN